MSIISKEIFEKFTEEEKKKNRVRYQRALTNGDGKLVHELENLFGKENLQPELKIKTWKDVQEMNENSNFFIRIDGNLELSVKVYAKCIAVLKIAKLIEFGYGGMVTNKEWEHYHTHKYCVVLDFNGNPTIECRKGNTREFIAFHTQQQAEEFMSYPENRTLVEHYYMR